MKNKLILAAFVTLFVTACGSTNNEKVAKAEVEKAMADPDSINKPDAELNAGEKVVKKLKISGYKCRNEAPTGSRIAKRVCTTKQQREARKKNSDIYSNEILRNQTGRMVTPTDGGE